MTNKASNLELESFCISDEFFIRADVTANFDGVYKPLWIEANLVHGPVAIDIEHVEWKETGESAMDFAATHYASLLALLEEELAQWDRAALVW